MRRLLIVLLASCSSKPVIPEVKTPARALLVGRAVLPANTFVEGPPSGAGVEGGPFSSQPAQGFSSLQLTPSGFFSISDNGYGVPETSADFLLRAWKLEPDLASGVLKATTLFVLSDPQRQLPWPIVNENTTARLLTGADLDPESFVRVADGTFWFGDEHGPFLVHVDEQGRVLEPPFELPIDGGAVLGADSPFLRANLMLRSAEALKVSTGTRTISPDHRWLTSAEQVKSSPTGPTWEPPFATPGKRCTVIAGHVGSRPKRRRSPSRSASTLARRCSSSISPRQPMTRRWSGTIHPWLHRSVHARPMVGF